MDELPPHELESYTDSATGESRDAFLFSNDEYIRRIKTADGKMHFAASSDKPFDNRLLRIFQQEHTRHPFTSAVVDMGDGLETVVSTPRRELEHLSDPYVQERVRHIVMTGRAIGFGWWRTSDTTPHNKVVVMIEKPNVPAYDTIHRLFSTTGSFAVRRSAILAVSLLLQVDYSGSDHPA